jgi:adenylylsulfate kinase
VAEQRSTNITWHEGQVSRKDRERVLGQRGATIWLTGLSGSGKSTIAVAAEKALTERGRLAYVLDGDNVRHGLNKNLGFSPEESVAEQRSTNITWHEGQVSRKDRERVLGQRGATIFETCESRDVKGLYQKARAGEIPEFTGISAPYEAPERPELVLDTNGQSVEESVTALVSYLERKGFLSD